MSVKKYVRSANYEVDFGIKNVDQVTYMTKKITKITTNHKKIIPIKTA